MLGFTRFLRHLNWLILKQTIACAMERRLTGLASEMAFHAMLGLFPAIIAILTAIGLFEQSVASNLGDLAIRFAEIVPKQVWDLLLDFTQEVKLTEGKSWFSLSFAAAIWVFSGVVSAAMNALDQIHRIPPKDRRSFWQAKLIAISLTIGGIILLIIAAFLLFIGDILLRLALQQNWGELLLFTWKIFSFILIIAIVFITIYLIYQIQITYDKRGEKTKKSTLILLILIISMLLIQIIYTFILFVQSLIIKSNIEQTVISLLISVWRLLSFPVSLGIVAIAFAFVYRFGKSRWRKNTPIMPGAILAAISWAIVSVLFRLYVSNFGQYNKVYGAVGAVIVLMLWLYLSSLVMLLGDQLNAIVAESMEKKLSSFAARE
jgi:membrane protein